MLELSCKSQGDAEIVTTWWWWWWWWCWWFMIDCFCGMVDRRKVLSLISSLEHCQRFSPSRISDTSRAGFEPAQNLSLRFVEWSCALVITTTPRRNQLIVTLTTTIFYCYVIYATWSNWKSQQKHCFHAKTVVKRSSHLVVFLIGNWCIDCTIEYS